MKKFRKKPIIIEAIQFIPSTLNKIQEILGADTLFSHPTGGYFFKIPTLEGAMELRYDNWLIKGSEGEYYPCRDDIFKAIYDAV